MEIKVSKYSWHSQLYRIWAKRHRTPARENLCHYMRVVLIWAPKDVLEKAWDETELRYHIIAAAIVDLVLIGLIFFELAKHLPIFARLAVSVFPTFVIYAIAKLTVERRVAVPKPHVRGISTPKLFTEFAKAKLGTRICPFIEFIEGDE